MSGWWLVVVDEYLVSWYLEVYMRAGACESRVWRWCSEAMLGDGLGRLEKKGATKTLRWKRHGRDIQDVQGMDIIWWRRTQQYRMDSTNSCRG